MNDHNIDDLFHRSGESRPVDPALLDRISQSMAASMQPVQPIAPPWIQAAIVLLLAATVAVVSAAALGLDGFHKLDTGEMSVIFPALIAFSWLAALLSASAMAPGSRRWINPALFLPLAIAGWIAVDVLLFHDYQLDFFVPQGIPCLRAGTIVAIPAGIASWLILRRGFAVHPAAAGLAAGTLAGLAGVIMLELHCPNQNAMHIMVWHTAVIPVAALAAAATANFSPRRALPNRHA